jgi:Ca-activated chloride channel homolog
MRFLFAALFIVIVASGALRARQEQAPVFKSRSDLVVLHVNVFDNHSDAVPSLTKDNFLVFEDDRLQKITFFSGEDVPVAAGLVIDNSSSMIARQKMVVAGSMAFAESSHPEDELFTVSFNERVRFGLPSHILFTSKRTLLRTTLMGLAAGGKTALYDAVVDALDHVEKATHQKHVLIVLSDGEDNASRSARGDMLNRAQQSDAIIYVVATSNGRAGEPADARTLRKLAEVGGGLAYFPRSDQEVVRDFEEIARNVRLAYSIGYVPTNTARDGGFRQIKVMARTAGRRLNVRCRDGYTAPGATSS